jgi:hypothetical protein
MMLTGPGPVFAERSSSDVPRIAVTRRRADRTNRTYTAARDDGTTECGNDRTNSREMTKTRWHAAHRRPLPYLDGPGLYCCAARATYSRSGGSMRLSPLRSYHRTSAVPMASQMTSPAAAATRDRVSPALTWASKYRMPGCCRGSAAAARPGPARGGRLARPAPVRCRWRRPVLRRRTAASPGAGRKTRRKWRGSDADRRLFK